jgi:Spy/CpxP family protein refolding chaperone
MKRSSRILPLVFSALAASAAAVANEPSGATTSFHGGHGHRLRHFDRCLSTLGLSTEQQAAIQSIRSDSRAAIQPDLAALKAAHAKLQADLSSGADKSVLGQDVLDQDASRAKLRSGFQATHDQIVAKLSPDQQTALATCSSSGRASGDSGAEQEPAQQ